MQAGDGQTGPFVCYAGLQDYAMAVHLPNGDRAGTIFCGQVTNEKSGTFDMIFMDVKMPNMNGLEATRMIRRLDHPDAKNIPIIAMTANTFEEDVQNCRAAGMTAHLAKPIEPNSFYVIIKKYYDKKKRT